jgi:hypothetical protein
MSLDSWGRDAGVIRGASVMLTLVYDMRHPAVECADSAGGMCSADGG